MKKINILAQTRALKPTTAPTDYNYFNKSSWSHFKERVSTIVLLAAFGLISGFILHHYESALERLIILALYIPMIADTGGNTGSQSATIIVRALALEQIQLKNITAVVIKELKISLMLASILGVCAYVKVILLSSTGDVPINYSLVKIALSISLALMLQVVTATLIGAVIPLACHRLGYDPANIATPALTTVVDITGLLIFFNVAEWVLGVI